MRFQIQLTAALRCRDCGRLYNVSGLQSVEPETDDVVSVLHEFDGPCPGCIGPCDGGSDTEVAAE